MTDSNVLTWCSGAVVRKIGVQFKLNLEPDQSIQTDQLKGLISVSTGTIVLASLLMTPYALLLPDQQAGLLQLVEREIVRVFRFTGICQ